MWLAAGQLAFGAALVSAYGADAAPLCEHRGEAHIAKHGGLLKDSAEHVARGELPMCDPSPQGQTAQRVNNNDRDGKSRFCRKRWYC